MTIIERREKLEADLSSAIRQIRALDGKINDAIQNLNREVALYAVGNLFDSLREKYKAFEKVLSYINEVQKRHSRKPSTVS
jgi:phage-related protein